jgi:predicted aspartyl protease
VGTFRVDIEIGDPQGEHDERVEALVGTGSTYTVVPRSMLERLGVTPHERDRFRLGDGRVVEEDIGRTWVPVDGRNEMTLVVFGEAEAACLLGAYTLRGFRLAPDPVGKRLVPVEGLLMASGVS